MNNWTLAKENYDPITMIAAPSPPPKAIRNPAEVHPQKSLDKESSSFDLFELLEKCQSQRLDDQRCSMPAFFSQVNIICFFKLNDLQLFWRPRAFNVLQISLTIKYIGIKDLF